MDTISYFPQHFNYSASPHLAQTTQSGHFCYKCQVPFVHTQSKPFCFTCIHLIAHAIGSEINAYRRP